MSGRTGGAFCSTCRVHDVLTCCRVMNGWKEAAALPAAHSLMVSLDPLPPADLAYYCGLAFCAHSRVSPQSLTAPSARANACALVWVICFPARCLACLLFGFLLGWCWLVWFLLAGCFVALVCSLSATAVSTDIAATRLVARFTHHIFVLLRLPQLRRSPAR